MTAAHRYRIDGVLQEVPVPSQIKTVSTGHRVACEDFEPSLNIAEKRLPQDGRSRFASKQRGGYPRVRDPDAHG